MPLIFPQGNGRRAPQPWPVASVLPPAKPQSAFLRTSGHDCTMISQRMLGWPTKDSTISNTEINADVTQNFLRNNVFEIFGQLGRPLLSPLQGWKFLGVYTLTEVTETLLGHTPGQHISSRTALYGRGARGECPTQLYFSTPPHWSVPLLDGQSTHILTKL